MDTVGRPDWRAIRSPRSLRSPIGLRPDSWWTSTRGDPRRGHLVASRQARCRRQAEIYKPNLISQECVFNGVKTEQKNAVIITLQADLHINETSRYEITSINAKDDLFSKAFQLTQSGKNYIVTVDTAFSQRFPNLNFLKRNLSASTSNLVFLLTNEKIDQYKIEATHSFDTIKMMNVTGMISGKSKKNEYVIFSGHYDHLGVKAR